jgi:hypothetical protein
VTQFSPAAQAIRYAAIYAGPELEKRIAAALRTAADRVVPVDRGSRRQCNIRAKFLAIAADLGGTNNTSQKDHYAMADVYRALCTHDSRHPDYESLYWDEDPMPTPQPDCSCDNCFYGRTELANEIIRLRSETSEGG